MEEKVQFIKIFDKKTAEQLLNSGFSYVKEQENKSDVYVFPLDSDLLELFQSMYNDKEFVCENKLRF